MQSPFSPSVPPSVPPSGGIATGARMSTYVQHIRAACQHIVEDDRLKPQHISLYVALFSLRSDNHFPNRMAIYRHQVMRRAKIRSKNTYAKSMAELSFWGYITYTPSRIKHHPSHVEFHEFYSMLLATNATATGEDLPLPAHPPDIRQQLTQARYVPLRYRVDQTSMQNKTCITGRQNPPETNYAEPL